MAAVEREGSAEQQRRFARQLEKDVADMEDKLTGLERQVTEKLLAHNPRVYPVLYLTTPPRGMSRRTALASFSCSLSSD